MRTLGAACLPSSARVEHFIGDFWDVVTSPFKDAADAVSDAWDDIRSLPGIEQVSDAVVDFLNTDVGKIVGKALGSALTGAFAPLLGPQLATIAWATPGMITGDSFSDAWIREFVDRTEQTAEYFGGDAASELVDGLGPAVDTVKEALADASISIDDLPWQAALDLDVREDLTAYALAGLRHAANLAVDETYELSNYDVETGKDMRVSDAERRNHRYAFVGQATGAVQTYGRAASTYELGPEVTQATGVVQDTRATSRYAFGPAPSPAPSPTPSPSPRPRLASDAGPRSRSSGTSSSTTVLVVGGGALAIAAVLVARKVL